MEARCWHPDLPKSRRYVGQSGIAATELAILLPLLLILVFGIIDFGRLIQTRLVLTNLAREGGSLFSRDLEDADNIISLLQTGADPLDLVKEGKIYVWRIDAGTSSTEWWPTVNMDESRSAGDLEVKSSIGYKYKPQYGTYRLKRKSLSTTYKYLKFDSAKNAAPIGSIAVVEVFYRYTPITPLSNFIPGLLTDGEGGKIISSRAVF